MSPKTLLALMLAASVTGCAGDKLPLTRPSTPRTPQSAAAGAVGFADAGNERHGSGVRHRRSWPRAAATGPAVYTCPHHPQVVSNQPGGVP